MNPFADHLPEAALAEIADDSAARGRLTAAERRHLDECYRCLRLVEGHRRAANLLASPWRLVTVEELAPSGLAPVLPRVIAGPSLRAPSRPGRILPLRTAIALLVLLVAFIALALAAGTRPPLRGSSEITFTLVHAEDACCSIWSVGLADSRASSWSARSGGAGGDDLPAWSPDGSRLAFARRDAVGSRIGVVNAAHPADVAYFGGYVDLYSAVAWSPDGTRIVAATGQIYIFDLRQSPATVIRTSAQPTGTSVPSWSPDGRYVLTAEAVSRSVVLIDASTGSQAIVARGAYVVGASPDSPTRYETSAMAWSPDGTMIAVTAYRNRGATPPDDPLDPWVRVMRVDGSDARDLAMGSDPIWSPTGAFIAFVARGGEIWVVRPDGTDLRRVAGGRHPLWSPDGSRLAFCSRALGPEDEGPVGIYVTDAHLGEPRLAYAFECWYPDSTFTWRPAPA